MKYLIIPLLILIMGGCASPQKVTITETATGIEFESKDRFSAEYEHNEKKAKVDTRAEPIIKIEVPLEIRR